MQMDMTEFENTIGEALERIPVNFKKILEEKGISILGREKVPGPVKKRFRNAVVFGIFIGVPYGRFFNVQTEPTRIELYKESFEQVFDGTEKIKEQIARTVVHEIAHYFGFSEEEIRKSGF
jgi:predicted Zn-dependent protease with MMP-like domain